MMTNFQIRKPGIKQAGAALFAALGFSLVLLPVSADQLKQRQLNDIAAAERELESYSRLITNQVANAQNAQNAAGSSHELLWTCVGAVLVGLLVTVKYFPQVYGARDIKVEAQRAALKASSQTPVGMAAEEQSFAAFAATFKVGPKIETFSFPEPARATPEKSVEAPQNVSPPPVPVPPRVVPMAEPYSVEAFYADAPGHVRDMRKLLDTVSSAPDMSAQQCGFVELERLAALVKQHAEDKALSPMWQLATALEAFANQLGHKGKAINASTLRTASAAIDLFEELAVPSLPSTLMSDPPIHVLAVDDDPISRHAVSFALKKALNLPDLASDGKRALELAKENRYDAIFLDIQMPGMDGFELCRNLHELEMQRETPVVFITCRNDFDSKAKSDLAGGCDLIGKPFLTFEVTLKALTLVLRNRAQQAKARANLADETTEPVAQLATA
jgi:CheY-like chemotaxis protein